MGIVITGKDYFDVTGDGVTDAFVRVACKVGTGPSSDQVRVFDGASSPTAPRVLGVLTPMAKSDRYMIKTVIAKGSLVTLRGLGWSANAGNCCGDMNWTRTYTWRAGKFLVGAINSVAIDVNPTTPSTSALPSVPSIEDEGSPGVGVLGDRYEIPGTGGGSVRVISSTGVSASRFGESEQPGMEYLSFRIEVETIDFSPSNGWLTRDDFMVQTPSGEEIYSADGAWTSPGGPGALNDGSSLTMHPGKVTSSTLTFLVPKGKPAVLLLTGNVSERVTASGGSGGWSFKAP